MVIPKHFTLSVAISFSSISIRSRIPWGNIKPVEVIVLYQWHATRKSVGTKIISHGFEMTRRFHCTRLVWKFKHPNCLRIWNYASWVSFFFLFLLVSPSLVTSRNAERMRQISNPARRSNSFSNTSIFTCLLYRSKFPVCKMKTVQTNPFDNRCKINIMEKMQTGKMRKRKTL